MLRTRKTDREYLTDAQRNFWLVNVDFEEEATYVVEAIQELLLAEHYEHEARASMTEERYEALVRQTLAEAERIFAAV